MFGLLIGGDRTLEPLEARKENVVSCMRCFSDGCVSVAGGEGGGREKGEEWDFELTSYHRVGTCRTPEDALWDSWMGRPGNADFRFSFQRAGKAGRCGGRGMRVWGWRGPGIRRVGS